MQIECSGCHRKFKVGESLAGNSVICPNCKTPIQIGGLDISDLLDELSASPVRTSAKDLSDSVKRDDQGILDSYIVRDLPSGKLKSQQGRRSFTYFGRNALSIPCFAMFLMSLLACAIVTAVILLTTYSPIQCIPFTTVSFCSAAFWYWLGESIRMGRTARLSDIFTEDTLHDAGVIDASAATHRGKHHFTAWAVVGAVLSVVVVIVGVIALRQAL